MDISFFEKMQKIISLFDNNYTSNIEAVKKNIRYLLNIFYLYTQIYIIYKKGYFQKSKCSPNISKIYWINIFLCKIFYDFKCNLRCLCYRYLIGCLFLTKNNFKLFLDNYSSPKQI